MSLRSSILAKTYAKKQVVMLKQIVSYHFDCNNIQSACAQPAVKLEHNFLQNRAQSSFDCLHSIQTNKNKLDTQQQSHQLLLIQNFRRTICRELLTLRPATHHILTEWHAPVHCFPYNA